MTMRLLFGDQLGDHFTDDHDGRFLMIESRAVFRRRRFQRAKAHLVLSAMRHRAAELGDRVQHVRAETYADGLARVRSKGLQVVHPTSRAALALVRSQPGGKEVELLPARGFVTSMDDFTSWAEGRGSKRLLMEDFYRDSRRRTGVLMDGDEPVGGAWNYDKDNREPPPRTGLDVPGPWWPEEDEIDEQVRRDLDDWEASGEVAFLGADGPRRFAVTQDEAHRALDHFLEHRLEVFGTYEDAVLHDDPWMAHSLVSAPLNLGLLDPLDVVRRAAERHATDGTRLASVEGFVRQVMGWRDYVWHLYWHLGEDYRHRNALRARRRIPGWFADLDADATEAACLSHTLAGVHAHGWVHHIPRLMILGSYALQRGWDPAELTDWFHRSFVDGYDRVMVPNVVGMSQHADGGVMATKPYTSGGAYLDRMTDHCGGCRFDPKVRVGDDACPFTAGYWWFLDRHRERFEHAPRMRQAVRGLDRLADLDALVEQEDRRGSKAP
ncbi:deoxyribodipyrimidine photolyase-related protein [Marmoricola bigeumensis]|uniref:Deoxyribodipyrimidine photolyase-related protein n=2 Tax=Nocardioides marmoribigeumensis TaxID=433649 RepID=A0ABU2BUD4_9ACTN|nr:deoxyribodipyrimidine photolyase-related protein [Nocardioides marmoribigeumensis]